jgi:hypothetical protein
MKDETASVLIKAFVGLRAKMYSLVHGDEEKRTAKGVSKAVIKTKLRHELYKQSLFNRESQMESMILFRTDLHNIYTVQLTKTTLSAYDDKRWNTHASSRPLENTTIIRGRKDEGKQ